MSRGFKPHRADQLKQYGTEVLWQHPWLLTRRVKVRILPIPLQQQALVVQRQRHRIRNAVTRVRVPPGALCVSADSAFFDNRKRTISAHDVAAAYCLAMAEVWVRLPLGAL